MGVAVSLLVSNLVPADDWTTLQWLFVGVTKVAMERLISPEYVSVHRKFIYVISAGLHGALLATVLFLGYTFLPRLRRLAGLSLALLVVVDVVLMVIAFPARPD